MMPLFHAETANLSEIHALFGLLTAGRPGSEDNDLDDVVGDDATTPTGLDDPEDMDDDEDLIEIDEEDLEDEDAEPGSVGQLR